MSDGARAATVVIGLGNPLMADDGVGLAALEKLDREWQFVPPVELVDGGTWGLNLLPVIESAGRVLLLDAINIGAAPGALVKLPHAELPRLLQIKVSPHQISVAETLALAELRGRLPVHTLALGLQPQHVELHTVLSPACAEALDELVAAAVAQLEDWGHYAWPAVACAAGNCASVCARDCACGGKVSTIAASGACACTS